MSWQNELEGPKWLPVLNATEQKYAIPVDLLARVAYEESRFREDIISGETRSPAGAVGIMQLEPQFWPGAGVDPAKDIDAAGRFLANLFQRFGDWQISLAAYNWGPGNVHRCLEEGGVLAAMPQETQNYVKQITGDVPVQGALI